MDVVRCTLTIYRNSFFFVLPCASFTFISFFGRRFWHNLNPYTCANKFQAHAYRAKVALYFHAKRVPAFYNNSPSSPHPLLAGAFYVCCQTKKAVFVIIYVSKNYAISTKTQQCHIILRPFFNNFFSLLYFLATYILNLFCRSKFMGTALFFNFHLWAFAYKHIIKTSRRVDELRRTGCSLRKCSPLPPPNC